MSDNQQQQPDISGVLIKKVDVSQIVKLAQSKKDIVKTLTHIGNYYLPEEKSINSEFIKLFLQGKKKLFKQSEVLFVKVPKFEEFSINKYFEQMIQKEQFKQYIPDVNDKYTVSKNYIFNVYNTVFPHSIEKKIEEAYKVRNMSDPSKKEHNEVKIQQQYLSLLKKSIIKPSKGKFSNYLTKGAKSKREPPQKKFIAPEQKY